MLTSGMELSSTVLTLARPSMGNAEFKMAAYCARVAGAVMVRPSRLIMFFFVT